MATRSQMWHWIRSLPYRIRGRVHPLDRIGACKDGTCWWCERVVGDGPGECAEPESDECDGSFARDFEGWLDGEDAPE